MIKVNPIRDLWLLSRMEQPGKKPIYTWINKFENTLIDTCKTLRYTTTIGYCDAAIYTNNNIDYTENSPIPFYFKMSPNRYFIDNFYPVLWNNTDIDFTINSKFTNNNKYPTPNKIFQFNNSYILFALQANNFREKALSQKLLLQLVYWAENNKKYILFKLHPFTGTNNSLLSLWDKLVYLKIVKKYAILVSEQYDINTLVDNAVAVWTYSSGVILQALLKDKPVAIFSKNSDYANLCRLVTTPEEASKITNTDRNSIYRFLTWYYNKLIIDVSSDNLPTKIYKRIEDCVKHDYDLVRIFS